MRNNIKLKLLMLAISCIIVLSLVEVRTLLYNSHEATNVIGFHKLCYKLTDAEVVFRNGTDYHFKELMLCIIFVKRISNYLVLTKIELYSPHSSFKLSRLVIINVNTREVYLGNEELGKTALFMPNPLHKTVTLNSVKNVKAVEGILILGNVMIGNSLRRVYIYEPNLKSNEVVAVNFETIMHKPFIQFSKGYILRLGIVNGKSLLNYVRCALREKKYNVTSDYITRIVVSYINKFVLKGESVRRTSPFMKSLLLPLFTMRVKGICGMYKSHPTYKELISGKCPAWKILLPLKENNEYALTLLRIGKLYKILIIEKGGPTLFLPRKGYYIPKCIYYDPNYRIPLNWPARDPLFYALGIKILDANSELLQVKS